MIAGDSLGNSRAAEGRWDELCREFVKIGFWNSSQTPKTKQCSLEWDEAGWPDVLFFSSFSMKSVGRMKRNEGLENEPFR
jgi:hypothetical protein